MRRRSTRARLLAVAVALVVVLGAVWVLRRAPGNPGPLAGQDRTFENDDPVARGCRLPRDELLRIYRGHDPAHSEDVTTVPQKPNYAGAFSVTSHSGPWDYLQTVPLALYGPSHIRASGEPLDDAASITDVYGTIGRLVNVELPRRTGSVLAQALERDPPGRPRLVVVVVWDGVGRNVLDRWPGRWPHLARLEREGTSYRRATVGSSPSITPATHSSLGTGAFPRAHGVTSIQYRDDAGNVRTAFAGRDPRDLKLSTFADLIDRALGNRPRVGALAWVSWHLGMLGHGSALEGGDKDETAFIRSTAVHTNDDYYTMPSFTQTFTGPKREARRVDRSDGRVDGKWLGNDIFALHDNPAWVDYQTRILIEMMKVGGYGKDAVPDLLFTNYKVSDIVGHQYSMDSKQMALTLEAQDASLGRMIRYLERAVGDYVVVLTADHGHTPSHKRTGAWPVFQAEVERDVNARFDVPKGRSLFEESTAVGPYLNRRVMKDLGVTAAEIARFLNGYTIADNWSRGELPDAYDDRGDENVFSAAFTKAQLGDVLECAFGSRRPSA